MESPVKPLQALPQQPLKGPTGSRLVLCNDDAGYPDKPPSSSPGRGRWFDNIASTDTKTFLRAGSDYTHKFPTWKWPAVVLTPEEYKLRVGGMSITELRSELEKYWGRGGIPGAAVEDGYQDMWVPAWARDNSYHLWWAPGSSPRLDAEIFSHWVNGECAKWLSYFVAKNHTFGVVHAWFAAFLGVIRESLVKLAESFTDAARVQDLDNEAFSHLKFRMSFDLCIENYDEAVDSLPSLPLNTKITINKEGMQVISDSINNMFPRRIWDICANTVIPATWVCGPPCPLTGQLVVGTLGVRPVSHAWVADRDLTFIVTEANQQLWPIPLPKAVLLEDVRGEMIRLGVRYAWLDVLCLRQQTQPVAIPGFSVSREIMERREQHRLEEWKVDVPTIGAVYSNPHRYGLYGEGPTIIFMSGLGRPFQAEEWASDRHWLRRAWTLQETPPLDRCLIAGLPGGASYSWGGGKNSGNLWPWTCKVHDDGQLLYSAMSDAACILPKGQPATKGLVKPNRDLPDLDALLRAMHARRSTNPIDKVCAIAFPFLKCGSHNYEKVTLPIYEPGTPLSVVWDRLISSITSTRIEACDLQLVEESKIFGSNELWQARYTPTVQLLLLFPHPSQHHWFPSWTQVQQYPNVSVRDNDNVPGLVTGGIYIDLSLRILSGRIYSGCSLQLTQAPTPKKKAIYRCTMDGKDAQLAATVAGIGLNINPGRSYVLVDISPDRSLWPLQHEQCKETSIGHQHPPIWQKSVIVVCEEVDTLAQPAVTGTQCPSVVAVTSYRLRRITTLEWPAAEPSSFGSLFKAKSRGPHWLPFKPSLVHIRSVVCSAKGGSHNFISLRLPDVFCAPAATVGLKQEGSYKKWDEQCPAYEVYLI